MAGLQGRSGGRKYCGLYPSFLGPCAHRVSRGQQGDAMTDQGQGAERLGPLARFLRNWRIARLTRAVTAAQATGEPAQVLARLLELVPLLVRQRGEDHAQTQSCINAVGLAYRSLERYDEAAIWYARAMA